MDHRSIISVSLLVISLLGSVQGLTIEGWTWSHQMDDKAGVYHLRTDTNLTEKSISFTVNLNKPVDLEYTSHWIAIGLSPGAELKNADVFVVTDSKNTDPTKRNRTFTDYYTTPNEQLVEDKEKNGTYIDWTLTPLELEPLDTINVTLFTVCRSFNVSNSTEDKEIKDENVHIFWAYGTLNDSTVGFHPDFNGNTTTKGYFPTNLLRPVTSSASVNLVSFIPLTAIVLFASIKTFAIC